ncbi:hypothetical protein LWI28_026190 [Acer negundo]|uniref:Integrase catalytic domain-containing protein n=1 Tax=Acer negundo TaxID=4023 RepID=A0AAD5J1C5_ACENE|nr:hypothetical protein LWI28_026190 [Acer negundo]
MALSGAEWRVWNQIKEAMQFDVRAVEIRKKLENHEGGVEKSRYKNGLLYYKNYVYVPGVPRLKEEILAHFHSSKEGERRPSSGGYESILVMVDRLSKGAHFIPLKHLFTASSVAKTFLDNVVKLHSIPQSIVNDRGKLFMSSFW